jgi:hypothetical protein
MDTGAESYSLHALSPWLRDLVSRKFPQITVIATKDLLQGCASPFEAKV